jgi:hypothetical protein
VAVNVSEPVNSTETMALPVKRNAFVQHIVAARKDLWP